MGRQVIPIVLFALFFCISQPGTSQGTAMGLTEWQQRQDSLRNEVLVRRDNDMLKGSFLEEMYIRKVVWATEDSVYLELPFNLHSAYDCGAPDCYSTDIRFSFPIVNGQVVFPHTVEFREHEYGCVPAETEFYGTFLLAEQTDGHIIYHSPDVERTLVLFREYNDRYTMAYYFVGVTEGMVTGDNVRTIIGEYEEEDKIYPYQSTMLRRTDYERFF